MKNLLMFAVSLILGLSLTGCAGALGEYPSGIWRYKMTVEVETPEGIKTGSSIREISAVSRPKGLGETNDTHVMLAKGEAVIVDLGARGKVFALLTDPSTQNPDQPIWSLFHAFPSPCPEGPYSRCGVRYYPALRSSGQVELKQRDYPMLVRFRDPNDMMTVESLLEIKPCDGTKASDNGYCITKSRFDEAFGQGVRLKSIKIAPTSEAPVIGEANKALPSVWKRNGFSRDDFVVMR